MLIKSLEHTARTTIYAALVLLSVRGPALCGETDLSADELQLRETAQQRSETVLRRYALSSAELAEKVAEAAFDKCKEPWNDSLKPWVAGLIPALS
ncbi:MAG: hypothetical protein USCAAHI_00113 [Beijerinckiaceae bacterium]|nr:MAG: hypothetical protein USCAAHI_00113 [Beijerinckiaceae bacterium]